MTCFGSKGSDHAGTYLDAAQPLFDSLGFSMPGLNFRGSFVFAALKKETYYWSVLDVKRRGDGPAVVRTGM